MFGDMIPRLHRNAPWKNVQQLAEELCSMFQDKNPLEHDAPLTIRSDYGPALNIYAYAYNNNFVGGNDVYSYNLFEQGNCGPVGQGIQFYGQNGDPAGGLRVFEDRLYFQETGLIEYPQCGVPPATQDFGLFVQENGAPVPGFGPTQILNLIEGTNISLTVADDPDNSRVNVTITSSGSGSDEHNLLSSTHPDTVTNPPTLGAIVTGTATPKWERLSGHTALRRKALFQTGTGSTSAVPAWRIVEQLFPAEESVTWDVQMDDYALDTHSGCIKAEITEPLGVDLTGVTRPLEGVTAQPLVLFIENRSTSVGSLFLKHLSTDSSVGNRFFNFTGADIELKPAQFAIALYDTLDAQWGVFAAPPVSLFVTNVSELTAIVSATVDGAFAFDTTNNQLYIKYGAQWYPVGKVTGTWTNVSDVLCTEGVLKIYKQTHTFVNNVLIHSSEMFDHNAGCCDCPMEDCQECESDSTIYMGSFSPTEDFCSVCDELTGLCVEQVDVCYWASCVITFCGGPAVWVLEALPGNIMRLGLYNIGGDPFVVYEKTGWTCNDTNTLDFVEGNDFCVWPVDVVLNTDEACDPCEEPVTTGCCELPIPFSLSISPFNVGWIPGPHDTVCACGSTELNGTTLTYNAGSGRWQGTTPFGTCGMNLEIEFWCDEEGVGTGCDNFNLRIVWSDSCRAPFEATSDPFCTCPGTPATPACTFSDIQVDEVCGCAEGTAVSFGFVVFFE